MTTTETPRTDTRPPLDLSKPIQYAHIPTSERLFPISLELAEEWKARAEKAEAEVERLRANLRRAVEIAENSNDSLMDWDENGRCETQKKNRDELDAIKATINPTNK